MLTILEFTQLTGKKTNTIRYHIKNNKRFREMFWKVQPVKYYNMRGYSYTQDSYVCDEGDISRILDWLNHKREYKKPNVGWTDIAIHCWEREMKCKGCNFEQYCSKFTHPPLKKKVLELVASYGEPILNEKND